MCGHVGIAGLLEHKDEATMKRMLLYDFFRGPDSTGFAAVKHATKEVKIAKIASHPLDLFDTKRFIENLSFNSSSAFIGHNRAATRGIVNTVNAHPYEYDHIVGCHNGTLSPASWRELETKIGETTNVDSQALIKCIAMFGIEETVPLLQGAWALVWYDKTSNTLNFLRNKERTFWVAYSKNFSKVFWASEWPMIRAATDLSNQDYEFYQSSEGYNFFATDLNTWYRYDLGKLRNKLITTHPEEGAKVMELKGKEPIPVVTHGYQGNSPFQSSTMGTSRTERGTSSTTSSTGNTHSNKDNILHFTGTKGSPFAGQITRERFEELAGFGCSYCSASIFYGDVGVTIFNRDDIILCSDCSTDPSANRVLVETLHILPPSISALI